MFFHELKHNLKGVIADIQKNLICIEPKFASMLKQTIRSSRHALEKKTKHACSRSNINLVRLSRLKN